MTNHLKFEAGASSGQSKCGRANAKWRIENSLFQAQHAKLILAASAAFVASATRPAIAETWVYAGTSQGTYQGRHSTLVGADAKDVHHVDVASIVSINGLRYFNRKITHYARIAGEWSLRYTRKAGNSRANCSRNALMLTSSDSDGSWMYRMNGNQWWNTAEVQEGSRSREMDIRITRLLGFNNLSELKADSDRLSDGYFRLVCGG